MECHALHGFGASASLGGAASGRFGRLYGLGRLGRGGRGLMLVWRTSSCEFNVVPGSSWR